MRFFNNMFWLILSQLNLYLSVLVYIGIVILSFVWKTPCSSDSFLLLFSVSDSKNLHAMKNPEEKLTVGDLCFAHVKTYPWWPARIVSKQVKTIKKNQVDCFSVIFFGTAETANLPAKDLVKYSPESVTKFVTKAAMRRKFYKKGYDEMFLLTYTLTFMKK